MSRGGTAAQTETPLLEQVAEREEEGRAEGAFASYIYKLHVEGQGP